MIKLEKYDKENQKLSFITDMDVSLANAIRRSVLEIPIMAVDEVEIIKNDSALYDEIIAHRIGLVPIKTEKGIKETKFKIVEKGPKTVYSTDIKPDVGTGYKIPLVILENGQELEINCNAKLGKGIEHIKYSPGLVWFKHNVEELDFVYIDENGKVSYDEEEILKKTDEEKRNKINKLKEIKELVFNIESWGQISPKEIFLRAIEALKENLEELDKFAGKD